MAACEHCGSTDVIDSAPGCPRCGAPNCCQPCCRVSTIEKLEAENARLQSDNEALRLNCPNPWCPECKAECTVTDEDHCWVVCGPDVVWPESKHIEENARLREALKEALAALEEQHRDGTIMPSGITALRRAQVLLGSGSGG